MYQNSRMLRRAPLCAIIVSAFLSACSQSTDALDNITTSSISPKASHGHSRSERECLARAMFFESNRSSRDGLVAVGTVVMNRLASDQYPDTICGVVGQKNQFAPGVLTRKMNSSALPDVMAAADAVLKGERHKEVKNAKFFHQAGLKFPYKNMHYVLEAGGNAFYEKRSRSQRAATRLAKAETAIEAVKADTAIMAYEVAPQAADAIGALLASQTPATAE